MDGGVGFSAFVSMQLRSLRLLWLPVLSVMPVAGFMMLFYYCVEHNIPLPVYSSGLSLLLVCIAAFATVFVLFSAIYLLGPLLIRSQMPVADFKAIFPAGFSWLGLRSFIAAVVLPFLVLGVVFHQELNTWWVLTGLGISVVYGIDRARRTRRLWRMGGTIAGGVTLLAFLWMVFIATLAIRMFGDQVRSFTQYPDAFYVVVIILGLLFLLTALLMPVNRPNALVEFSVFVMISLLFAVVVMPMLASSLTAQILRSFNMGGGLMVRYLTSKEMPTSLRLRLALPAGADETPPLRLLLDVGEYAYVEPVPLRLAEVAGGASDVEVIAIPKNLLLARYQLSRTKAP